MIPSKKDLEIILSTIKDFEKPKPALEQYTTPSSLAAEILWQAYLDGNIEGKTVADLGCGTGILVLGASILGAKQVFGYDIDEDAIKIAEENKKLLLGTKVPIGNISFIIKDITNVTEKFDTVIMNPPFGIQKSKKGADTMFLRKAFEIGKAVYSFHRAEEKNYPAKVAEEHDFNAVILAEEELQLKATMEFHTKRKYNIKVGLWRFMPK
jgi:putative methylase